MKYVAVLFDRMMILSLIPVMFFVEYYEKSVTVTMDGRNLAKQYLMLSEFNNGSNWMNCWSVNKKLIKEWLPDMVWFHFCFIEHQSYPTQVRNHINNSVAAVCSLL